MLSLTVFHIHRGNPVIFRSDLASLTQRGFANLFRCFPQDGTLPRKRLGGGGDPLLDDSGSVITKRAGLLTTIHGARRTGDQQCMMSLP